MSSLTRARREMLEHLKRERGYFADFYPPMKWALNMGYAKEVKGMFEITAAGREALLSTKPKAALPSTLEDLGEPE